MEAQDGQPARVLKLKRLLCIYFPASEVLSKGYFAVSEKELQRRLVQETFVLTTSLGQHDRTFTFLSRSSCDPIKFLKRRFINSRPSKWQCVTCSRAQKRWTYFEHMAASKKAAQSFNTDKATVSLRFGAHLCDIERSWWPCCSMALQCAGSFWHPRTTGRVCICRGGLQRGEEHLMASSS